MDPSDSSELSVRDTIKEQGCQILRGLTLRVLGGIFHASDHTQRAATRIAHLVMEPLTILMDSLPSRKAWSAGPESSDYVDGWNDALDSAERVVQHVMKRLADETGENADRAKPMEEGTRRALLRHADDLRQLTRNGRYGTCGGCPRDVFGQAYPEFCASTERIDHQLTLANLAESFEAERKTT